MLRKEILAAFRDELGWKIKSFNGKRYCVKSFPDRSLRVFFHLINLDDKQVIDTLPAVSTDELLDLCAKIYDCKEPHEALVATSSVEKRFYAQKFLLEDLHEIDKKLSSWAMSQDLEESFRFLEDSQRGFGSIPRTHLAALARAGDVFQLRFYQECFEDGDQARLELAPKTTKDHIDRALALAEQKTSNT